ncbi:MAG TPA: hypothetical protein VGQ59_10860 [Cyclobacteriaceae bacterium]|jgi:hypothetical protein|nr:hypothetical protein [Cyclobacteriaceae bacterium]
MENQDLILDHEDLSLKSDIEPQRIISLSKFILFSILTFSLYELWWMYKAWRFFKQKDKLDVAPAARTIFCIFFLTSLMKIINDYANEKGYTKSYSPVLLFFGFLIGSLLAYLPEPFWLISLLSVVFLIPPFRALNFARRNSTDFVVEEQTSLSGRQIALVVIGVTWWGLALIGLFLG